MAGKIVADTLEHSTAGSVDTQYVVNGSAKAWSAFDGSGTVAIDGSNNVSTLTDNGTGDYTITLTNSMANVNYAPVSSCNYNGTSPDFVGATVKTVNTTRFKSAHDSGSITDMDDIYATWDGDLA